MLREEHHNHALVTNQVEREEMKTPEDVAVMLRLAKLGWGKKRIARELGVSKATIKKYLNLGDFQPYRQPNRKSALDGLENWIKEQFIQHKGNAEVVRQLLAEEKEIVVSLRTIERAVAPYRQELEVAAKATIRFETPPGRQLQIDFGVTRVEIGGVLEKVFLFVATLGYSRRIFVAAFRHEGQASWLTGMDSAFRHFNGVPDEVLMDNAKALVKHHDPKTREVEFNERLASFARYWCFKPRACAPYRARTKGKDERSVGYVKRNAIAGRKFESWDALEGHLQQWCLNVADQRIHGTTAEKPLARFEKAEASALKPINGKPPFLQSRDYNRKVNPDAHVEYETNNYSVPWEYIGKQVHVRRRQDQVCIFLKGEEISSHQHHQGRRQRITETKHLQGILRQERNPEKTSPPKEGKLQRPLTVYDEVCGG